MAVVFATRFYLLTLLCAAALCLVACSSPTTPDSRLGYLALRVRCDGSGVAPLTCRAETVCAGSYRCPDPAADGRNVTAVATWTSADTGIVRVLGPGRFEAVSVGNTVIHASVPEAVSPAQQTVAVFERTAALPTHEIVGSVNEAGKTGAISGATVEVRNGLIAGRTAISGVPPSLPPGFLGPFGGPGYYRFVAVPPGAYTLRVTWPGYVTQEQTVEVTAEGGPSRDVALSRP